MASILDRYGIKEVADVTFYKIGADGNPAEPVLFLDTLKVSTIEQTAESVDARGGKGNPKLITWDYGKEITVNIEDALFSPKSMSIMLGDGTVAKTSAVGGEDVQRTTVIRINDSGEPQNYFIADVYDSATKGSVRKKVYMGSGNAPAGMIAFDSAGITLKTAVSEEGTVIDSSLTAAEWSSAFSVYSGKKVFITYTVKAIKKTITVSGDTFPGTYYVVGDTYSRSDIDGSDQFFQFIIPKAKMSSENTITLEAEGDPSTFNMNLTVLRPEDGDMMKLVQYDLVGA